MDSSWDKFEELIRAEMRKTYSEAVVEHSMNPRNLEGIKDADGFAKVTGPCGDTMSIWLKFNSDTITNASFLTDGCGTTVASGSMVTEMAKGKSIEEARQWSLKGVEAVKGGGLWCRQDLAAREHIQASIEHMKRLRG